jgi:hypothetical protein
MPNTIHPDVIFWVMVFDFCLIQLLIAGWWRWRRYRGEPIDIDAAKVDLTTFCKPPQTDGVRKDAAS